MKKNAKLNFKTVDGYILLHPEEIYYFKSEDIYAFVHDGKTEQFINASLKAIEAILPEGSFIRCHRSYIVNIKKVTKIIKAANSSLMLGKGIIIPISRGKKNEVLKILGID